MFSRGDGILNKDLNDIDYQYHNNIKSQGGFTLYRIISLGKTSMIAVMLTLVLLLSACGQAANQGMLQLARRLKWLKALMIL